MDKQQLMYYLGILRFGNVDENLRSRVNNVEKLHDSSTIIRNGSVSPLIMDQLVHTPWSKGGSHDIGHSHTSINVAY